MLKKWKLLLLILLASATVMAQNKTTNTVKKDTAVHNHSDSTIDTEKDAQNDNIAVVTIDDNDQGDGGSQNVSSVLTAGRDPFYSIMSFNFNAVRLRIRGYDGDLNTTYLNGIQMDNLDNGFTPFGLWGGLNDVMRNRDMSLGLRYNTFTFGDIGSSTNIDARASKERKQTQFGYAISNRNYTHRLTFYHGTGISKKGWAFVAAASFRGADEAYIPGTFYNGYSYFIGIDKRFTQRHLLSLTAFNAPTESGRQISSVDEMRTLSNDKYYNPGWGYQNGKKRNANVAKSNQPTFILNDEYRFNNRSTITTAISATIGKRSSSALDWYNSADPRPDYYRYLPSYIQDPYWQQQAITAMQNDVNLRQINWERLYNANRSNTATIQNANGIAGNSVTGKRSVYIVEDRVINTKRLNFNSVFNTSIGNHLEMMGGVSMQSQVNNYYKEVNDLLGGEFYVNLNQFAERDFPANTSAGQNNLLKPNQILNKGDKFGYDYDINISKYATWLQGVFKFNKFDYFAAVELSNTLFFRNGKNQNGLYPNNSYGKSAVYSFNNYALKGGITYKINGRNYMYLNAAKLTRAPLFDNVFLSPRTRDIVQDNITSEKISTIEGGYVLNAPKIKARITGFYTKFDDGMNVLTFYHDDYRNFVNYGLTNIDKLHFGGEFGLEARAIKNVTINAAAAIGRYYYNSRQLATVTLDNSTALLSKDVIYSENYRVAGTPQEAYSLGVTYNSPKFWRVGLSVNYFDQLWLDFNPIRRTYRAVEGLDATKPEDVTLRQQILSQQQLDANYTLDFFWNWSWRLPKSWGLKTNHFLVFNVGINNLLNNQNIVSGGFEQLRFDYAEKNLSKFPPKMFYAYGLNYFASITYRF